MEGRTGSGAAALDFQHNGSIEITGIQFVSANTGMPLIQTTNAMPDIHDCVFSGGGSGFSCVTDAIVLGGTGSTIGAGDSAPYQGYQGSIRRNLFDGIRRIAVFQVFANSIEIHENTVSTSCGNGGLLLSSSSESSPWPLEAHNTSCPPGGCPERFGGLTKEKTS